MNLNIKHHLKTYTNPPKQQQLYKKTLSSTDEGEIVNPETTPVFLSENCSQVSELNSLFEMKINRHPSMPIKGNKSMRYSIYSDNGTFSMV